MPIKGLIIKGMTFTEESNDFLGTTNSSYNTDSNWSKGYVALTTENTIIKSNCNLNVASKQVNNLGIISGVSFTFGSTNRTFSVNGNFNCNGILNMTGNTHTLNLNGNFNSCNRLITDSNNSTISYGKTTSGQEIFSSDNYRNLTVTFKTTSGGGVGKESYITGNKITVGNTLNLATAFLIKNGQSIIINGTTNQTLNNSTLMFDGNFIINNSCNLTTNSNDYYGNFIIGSGATISITHSNSPTFHRYSRVIAMDSNSKYKNVSGTLVLSMDDNTTQFMSGGLIDFSLGQINYTNDIYGGSTNWGALKVLPTNYNNLTTVGSTNLFPILVGNTVVSGNWLGTKLNISSYTITISGTTTNLQRTLNSGGNIICFSSCTLNTTTPILDANMTLKNGLYFAGTSQVTYTSSVTLTFSDNNQFLATTNTNQTAAMPKVVVSGITVTKSGTGTITITNISGSGGASTFNRSGTTTVTNNLGGVIVN